MAYPFCGLYRRSWVFLTPRIRRFLCHVNPQLLIIPPQEIDALLEDTHNHVIDTKKQEKSTSLIALAASFLILLYILLAALVGLDIVRGKLYPSLGWGMAAVSIYGELRALCEKRKGKTALAEYSLIVVNNLAEDMEADLEQWEKWSEFETGGTLKATMEAKQSLNRLESGLEYLRELVASQEPARRKMHPQKIKRQERVRELWEKGLTDREIASRVMVSSRTVRRDRKEMGLKSR